MAQASVSRTTDEYVAHPASELRRPPGWTLRGYGLSDTGRVRQNNEDVYLVGELSRTLIVHGTNVPQPDATYGEHRGYIFLVADGVGGHQAGEIASRLSTTSIERFLLNTLRRFTHLNLSDEQVALRDLQTALGRADAHLFHQADQHPEWQGMGCTMTLALVIGRRLFIAHAGDSRCYIHSNGELRQLTRDHTVAAEMARHGIITPEEQANHPWRHMVTNLLGGNEPGVRVDVMRVDLDPNDLLLLCSDGLYEMVPDADIAAILGEGQSPEAICRRLVDEANQRGGKDNVTVVVARVEQEDH